MELNPDKFQILIVAVAHEAFKAFTIKDWTELAKGKIVFDIKGIVPRELSPIRL